MEVMLRNSQNEKTVFDVWDEEEAARKEEFRRHWKQHAKKVAFQPMKY
jgi:hypothetical protein